ncbi:MAG: hypothetical protein KDD35_11445, partial [Bdellovibrionales bacterium]|nr:hypothetical protein [Bdellovibrionales bacterium]
FSPSHFVLAEEGSKHENLSSPRGQRKAFACGESLNAELGPAVLLRPNEKGERTELFEALDMAGAELLGDIYRDLPFLTLLPKNKSWNDLRRLYISLQNLPNELLFYSQRLKAKERKLFANLAFGLREKWQKYVNKNGPMVEMRKSEELTRFRDQIGPVSADFSGMAFETLLATAFSRLSIPAIFSSELSGNRRGVDPRYLADRTCPRLINSWQKLGRTDEIQQLLSLLNFDIDFIISQGSVLYWVEAKSFRSSHFFHKRKFLAEAKRQMRKRDMAIKEILRHTDEISEIRQILVSQFDLGEETRKHILKAGAYEVIYLLPDYKTWRQLLSHP